MVNTCTHKKNVLPKKKNKKEKAHKKNKRNDTGHL